jgi:phosphoribosyl-ATP pyrophosphohydrolase/phosphoribosyl-AMP cyclohydrolase
MGLEALKFGPDGLLTVVVQDRLTGELRMLAHANEAALQQTLDTGEAHFYSRSRAAMWRKGETSGHVLHVREIWADCDADAVVYLVDPEGPSCHTGRTACFFRVLERDGSLRDDPRLHAQSALPRLWSELLARAGASAERSYTRKLLDGGPDAIGAKLREEADELARAVRDESEARVVSEAADVLYHVLVGLLSRGTSLRDVEAELARRFGTSGIAEKQQRNR